MVLRLNKPILFSVEHKPADVEKALKLFRKTIRGKRFLFIELTPENVEQIIGRGKFSHSSLVAAYQRLAAEAHKVGLKVFALDSEKFSKELMRAEVAASTTIWPATEREKAKAAAYYQDYNKRELDWLRKLHGVGSSAVLVMNPAHAAAIAEQLNLPKEHIIGELWLRTKHRALAEQELARIEEARLERKMLKAWERMERIQRDRKVGTQQPKTKQRSLAEAAKIQAARLERRRRKALERMKRPQRRLRR